MEVISVFHDLLCNPKHTRWLLPLLLAAEALLCTLIIWKVPYTEIDWQAYMEQVSLFLSGERDYTKIKGGTGPLVYPAFHVYIYTGLYYLTDQGKDILSAQIIFAGVYLATLGVVIKCYQAAKIPPYILPMLLLSKRMHSIFLLRCFNDCFAVVALFITIYAFQRRMWTTGCLAYSVGLGIKMNLLLVLPALGVVLIQAVGASKALRLAGLIAQVQFIIALPFLQTNAAGYRSRAFEFTRQFLFKWTVNWRFVGEETFLSRSFSIGLLAAHIALLLLFLTSRWANPSKEFGVQGSIGLLKSIFNSVPSEIQQKLASQVTPKYIMATILSANTIGMLCARSLHYQFFSWTAWATPFLLWQSGWHPLVIYALWAAQEWAWNVYPSTKASSITVVGVLGLTVIGVWWGTRSGPQDKLEKSPEHVD